MVPPTKDRKLHEYGTYIRGHRFPPLRETCSGNGWRFKQPPPTVMRWCWRSPWTRCMPLLAEPDCSPGGHRLYDPQAVTALRVIKAAQRLGFSLEEVAELLEADRH